MMKTLLKNATIVKENQLLENASILISDGKIENISGSIIPGNETNIIDVKNSFVLPGLIDIHTDALEYEIVPRPAANLPIEVAYNEIERKMCGCGITTAYHSLYMGFKKTEELMKTKYSRKELFDTIYELNQKSNLINHKLHLRFEITGGYAYDLVCEYIESGKIDLVSVMDHTPGQGQFKNGKSIDDVLNIGNKNKKGLEEKPLEKISDSQLEELFSLARKNNIPLAIHDMDTPEQVQKFHAMGAGICEFPINMETGQEAVKLGMCSLGGATNILRGGSLNGNLNVKHGIENGAIDGICSDYYLPSILHSVFMLSQDFDKNLSQSINLATKNVAKAVGIDHETGSVNIGKNADLIVVSNVSGLPKIEYTFNKGKISSSYNY